MFIHCYEISRKVNCENSILYRHVYSSGKKNDAQPSQTAVDGTYELCITTSMFFQSLFSFFPLSFGLFLLHFFSHCFCFPHWLSDPHVLGAFLCSVGAKGWGAWCRVGLLLLRATLLICEIPPDWFVLGWGFTETTMWPFYPLLSGALQLVLRSFSQGSDRCVTVDFVCPWEDLSSGSFYVPCTWCTLILKCQLVEDVLNWWGVFINSELSISSGMLINMFNNLLSGRTAWFVAFPNE